MEAGLSVVHLFAKPTESLDREAVVASIKAAEADECQVITAALLGHKADVAFMALAPDWRTLRTLQTGLQRAGLDVAVRYLPAARVAQVGGDWYDAFSGPDGALTLVVGDVTGHDRRAAATMAQVRNLLRGVVYAGAGSPARSLAALDRAGGVRKRAAELLGIKYRSLRHRLSKYGLAAGDDDELDIGML